MKTDSSMGLSQCLFDMSIYMLYKLFLLFNLVVIANSLYSLQQPSCHDEESSALLHFKQSFILDASASFYAGAYPKVSSWKPAKGANSSCCSWDGVECDVQTGHVIGLDLSSSCLYGSINSNSSLFRLVHLRRLNLADNDFNYSQIPTSIRNFPRLTYLNLSASVFSGQVPPEVSHLSKLSSLDLSINLDIFSDQGLLKLNPSNMRSLVQNLTSLEKLHLSFVNIFSTVPNSMANLSSMTSLLLRDSGIFGEFPVRIFSLPNLKILSVRYNPDLTGYLPEFNQTSPLMSLWLGSTSFSGHLPSSIAKLDLLQHLDVSACNFSEGLVPSSIGNLRQLTYLDISANKFVGSIPDSLSNLTELTCLSLSFNEFSGGPLLPWVGKGSKLNQVFLEGLNLNGFIPSSLENLTQLTHLSLHQNQFTGPIPFWLGNLTRLTHLDLGSNKLNSSIPKSLSNLMNLQELFLYDNRLSGAVEFHMFLKLLSLKGLRLGDNKLELLIESRTTNATIPQFTFLGLGSCNIREFPDFLRYQENLQWLGLYGNKIRGQVPKWIWNASTETLKYIDMSSNMLFGELPIPSPNVEYYQISNNNLTGEVSPLICSLSQLQFLDFSNNRLSGTLPQCLGNFSDGLQVLSLGNNSFHGILPQTYTMASRSNLRMIDVSYNHLQGQLPTLLANCVMLEFMVLSRNKFNDVFPLWFGTLTKLKLVAMDHNEFYDVIKKPEKNLSLPELRFLDLSYNNFTGEFPLEYIFSGNGMRGIALNQPTYLKAEITIDKNRIDIEYSITATNKGVERYFAKIQEDFMAIDLSSNKFEGRIPEFIGNLKGLLSLNISNNILTGSIPLSLGNLTQLESLDLSHNNLSGEIPPQLAQLTSLGKFDVSHNNLTGTIPQGRQLTTFDSTSYEGNPGLCGDPLPNKCRVAKAAQLPPSSAEENDAGSAGMFEFDWKFVLAGLGSGLVVGVVLADVAITRRKELFVKIVGMIRLMITKRESWE